MTGKPWLTTLTFLGFYINAAIDHGKGSEISFEDIYQGLENETLFQDLERKLPNSFDFSLFPAGSEKEKELIAALQQAAGGLEGREGRKVGVENSGLSLLMAFILEAIQQEAM
ncbi:MAG: hypothetical protein PHH11_18760 [Methylomonas sp.]|nr:hypothetical protein [Methylomonas sp.]